MFVSKGKGLSFAYFQRQRHAIKAPTGLERGVWRCASPPYPSPPAKKAIVSDEVAAGLYCNKSHVKATCGSHAGSPLACDIATHPDAALVRRALGVSVVGARA